MFTYLRDVVGPRAELVGLEPVVDAVEHLLVEVCAGVDAPQVAHKVLPLHPPAGLDRPRVQVRVEEDDGVGEDEDGVGGAEAGDEHLVAGDVPPREHLHHLFDFLSLAWIGKENGIEADWQEMQEATFTTSPMSQTRKKG